VRNIVFSRNRDQLIVIFASLTTLAFPLMFFGIEILSFSGILQSQGDLTFYYVLTDSISKLKFPINDQFGFPTGLNWGYFPTANWLNLIPISLIDAMFGIGHGLKWVFIFSFPISFLVAYACGREIKLSKGINLLISYSATLLPWHFYRIFHFDYGVLYPMFLCVLLGLRQFRSGTKPDIRSRTLNYFILLCIVLSGPYYLAFTVIILLSVFFIEIIQKFEIQHAIKQFNLLIYSVIAFLILQIPFVLGQYRDISSQRVIGRSSADTLLYGGRLDILMSPSIESNLPYFSQFLKKLPRITQINEAQFQSNYGTLATTIFLLVFLGYFTKLLFTSTAGHHDNEVIVLRLGVLTTFCILFFTVGGPNHLIALYLTPQIRAWNRMTPVILMLVLLGGGKSLELILRRNKIYVSLKKSQKLLVAVGVFSLVLLDQSPKYSAGSYLVDDARQLQSAVAAYNNKIEELIPEKCGILQLPVMSFPENGPINGLDTYKHFDVSLQNPNKNWTFGAVKNVPGGSYQSKYADRSAETIFEIAKNDGLCGIHVDIRGFSVGKETDSLIADFGVPAIVGNSGNWLFFRVLGKES
jgi:phosphoglycerol transferase